MSKPRVRRVSATRKAPGELEELRRRLAEAEETLAAIRSGAVDAFVIQRGDEEVIYTLESADRPYRMLVDCMQEGALVLTTDGTILFANGRMAEMLGVKREELAATGLAGYVVTDGRARLARLLSETRDGEPQRDELLLSRADGTRLPVHLTVNMLPAAGPEMLCAIATDLTGRKELEELQRAQASQVDLERRKDEFLAALAHELRSPLAPLRNGLQIMELAARDPRLLDDARSMMKRQVQRLVRLIDDLIDVSRIASGRLELRREVRDVTTLVREAIEMAKAAIDDGGHVLSKVLPATPVYVEVDAARMTNVLAGLLDNACKFSRRGGRIEVAVEQDRTGRVAISVRDWGVGIPADVLPHVFELFAQMEPAPERLHSGLGVGLSIAQRLVEVHGGTIEARSGGLDTGSEFVVLLPVASDEARPVTRPRATPASRASSERPAAAERRRILVADDNVDSARSLAQLLTLRGHDVRTAYQGAEAYEMADWFRPHILLLDIGMPNGDGFEVCRRIRSQPWGRRITLIAVTAWGQPQYERASRDAGFEHYLVKPIEPPELMELLDGLPASPDIIRESPAS